MSIRPRANIIFGNITRKIKGLGVPNLTDHTEGDTSLVHYLLDLWYIGTNFAGSQRQPDKRTVEGELLAALIRTGYIKDDKESSFKAVARTDKGVHARHSGFSFFSKKRIYINEINNQLPNDMGINRWAVIPDDFKPRFNVVEKEYRYFLPLLNGIDDEKLTEINNTMQLFKGHHDFTLFSKRDRTADRPSTITLNDARCLMDSSGKLLIFIFKARMFLWQQIRRMIAAVNGIINGDLTIEDIKRKLDLNTEISEKNERKLPPFNPDGLILWNITYPSDIVFGEDASLSAKRKKRLEKHFIISAQRLESAKALLFDQESK